MNLLMKVSLVAVAVIFLFANFCQSEICPDHKISCRKGQTCCNNMAGGYGCCPYENATCCSDGLHCCPEGTQCDLSAGRCHRAKKTIIKQARLIPVAAFDTEDDVDSRIDNDLETNFINATIAKNKKDCPDQKSSCPSSYTCCADPDGSYACCPFTNGTCCSDKIHCCPHGQNCRNSRCE